MMIKSMRIYEIYRSIQGESSYAGQPCTFIRTAGCSLRCVYCDTGYALPFDSGSDMTVSQILSQVEPLGFDLVELTGGEPLEQKETPDLCQALLGKGATVLVETGGHISINQLPKEVVKILDIKTPGSRMTRKIHWDNLKDLTNKDEIKFVLCDQTDFDWAVNVCNEHGLFSKHVIHFSPSFGVVDPQHLAQWIVDARVPVRLQMQIHKYIWDPSTRGV